MIGRTNAQIVSGEQPFVPPDDKTYIFVTIPKSSSVSMLLYILKSNTATLSIDWGDGGAVETNSNSGAISLSHSYAAIGDYVIKMWISSGTGTYTLGRNTTTDSLFGGSGAKTRQFATKIYIGANTVIAKYALQDSRSLEIISVYSGITSIGEGAFYNCYKIDEIILPATITTIGSYAFATGSFAPFELTITATTPPTIQVDTFSSTTKNYLTKIYVPAASLDAYKAATNWSVWANYMEAIE